MYIYKREYIIKSWSSPVLLAITTILFANLAAANPWGEGWKYRKKIVVDHTKVNADLTNFPVLISLDSDPNLVGSAQADGDDILFTDSSSTLIPHEIELYDSNSGHLVAWVNVPFVSSSIDTTFYMYYGNASAVNQENVEAVWDSNYIMVHHFEEDGVPESGYWQKYDGNPILGCDRCGFGTTVYDANTSIYHHFTSWGSVLHFTSPDGINWTPDDEHNPVLSSAGVPMTWKEGDKWYMLYRYNPSGRYVIGLAKSLDGINWTKDDTNNPVLSGDPNQWDDRDLDPWGVIKIGSTYYLWYCTIGGVPGLNRCTGLATSTNLIDWTKDPNNPIFTDGRFCVDVFSYGGYYYMLVPRYTPHPFGEIELYRDTNPTFYENDREFLGVVIAPGAEDEWDNCRFDTPFVFTDNIYRNSFDASNNELWIYYAGTGTPSSGSWWWTGMCIEPNIAEALDRNVIGNVIITDSTSNHIDGQIQGYLKTCVTGKINGADDFDGSDDYIDLGDNQHLSGMNSVTVEAWVLSDSGNSAFVSKWDNWTAVTGGSYILWQRSAKKAGWGVITETGWAKIDEDTPVLQPERWYHLVGVYDGTEIKLYVNGDEVGTPIPITGRIASTDHPCYIGRYTTVRMDGMIDEVRVSNTPRNEGWIKTTYNNQLLPNTFYRLSREEEFEADTLVLDVVGSSLYVKPGEHIVTKMEVMNLQQKVNACQAMLGFNSTFLTASSGCIVPGGGVWDELIYNSWDVGAGVSGEIDTAIGIWVNGHIGTDADGTVAIITLTADSNEGATELIFRPDVPDDDTKQTFLSSMSGGAVWPYKVNSQTIVIDGTSPSITDLEITRKVYESNNVIVEITANVIDALAGLSGPPVIDINGPQIPTAVLVDAIGPLYGWEVDVNSAQLNDVYTVTITATDLAGNETTEAGKINIVYFSDITEFCEQWLLDGIDIAADLNEDGYVDFQDYAILANIWMEVAPQEWPFE